MGVKVTAADGSEWEVSRRLRWPRMRRMDGDGWEFVPLDVGNLGDGLAGIVFTIVALLVLTGLIVVLLPLILFAIEVPIAVAASVFLTRAWIVSAETVGVADPPRYSEWRVRGFLRSRRAVREVAMELRRGVRAEPQDAE